MTYCFVRAISEATIAHWKARTIGSANLRDDKRFSENPLPRNLQQTQQPQQPLVTDPPTHFDPATHDGAGGGGVEDSGGDWIQRGRWDYVVGLVGKPSAGEGASGACGVGLLCR